MAVLSKATVQRLAVLRTLSMWRRGAFGPLRVHKTLFFADRDIGNKWHLFTFKRWFLGQYSDEIAESLNALKQAGRITAYYDGPSERISGDLLDSEKTLVLAFFSDYFPDWEKNLLPAFRQWAYLTNDRIVKKAHDDPTYTTTKHGETILKSFHSSVVEFEGLSDEDAETLSDIVDIRLQNGLRKGIAAAADKPIIDEDWNAIYFGEESKRHKTA